MGKKGGSGIPFLDGALDLAGGLTMAGIANKMEQKYHYRKKRKINPYAATAFGIASGRLRTTESLLRLGGALGAAGSFDVEADPEAESENERLLRLKRMAPEDPLFNTLKEASTNDNQFAWRMNFEDGSEHDVNPLSYTTYEEYKEALSAAKKESDDNAKAPSAAAENEQTDSAKARVLLCRVSRLDNGVNQYYRIGSRKVRVGDIVKVPSDSSKTVEAVVLAIEEVEAETLSISVDEIPGIL